MNNTRTQQLIREAREFATSTKVPIIPRRNPIRKLEPLDCSHRLPRSSEKLNLDSTSDISPETRLITPEASSARSLSKLSTLSDTISPLLKDNPDSHAINSKNLLFESVLGKGAYGRVYRALNKENGKFLAVKVISLNLHSKRCKSTLGKLGKLYCRTGDFVASEAGSS